MSVQWSGLDAFKAELRTVPDELVDDATAIVQRAAQQTAAATRARYPQGQTGTLRSRVTVSGERSRGGTRGVVQSRAPHTWIVEQGTRGPRRTRAGANRGTMPALDRADTLAGHAIPARARMYRELVALLRTAGFQVSS